MHLFKFVDAINQCLYAFHVHSVVAGSAETTYQTVSLDTYHTLRGSELEELVEQTFIFGFENEADVHTAAVLFLHNGRGEEFAVIEAVIEEVSLLLVALVHPLDAAVFFVDITKKKRGHYLCQLRPLTSDARSYPDYQLTEVYMQELEKMIRRNPSIWLWSHRRWKHKRPVPEQ